MSTDSSTTAGQAPALDGSRSAGADFTDPAAWERLQDAADPQAFAAAWLDLQCRLLGDVTLAVLVLHDTDTGELRPQCWWQPPAADATAGSSATAPEAAHPALTAVAELAVAQRRGAVRRRGGDGPADAGNTTRGDARDVYAWPLMTGERVAGVVAVEAAHRGEPRMQQVMRLLQWGAAWWQPRLTASDSAGGHQAHTGVLGVLVSAMEANGLAAAATAAVTELALVLDCDRVAYGSRPGRHVRVRALSHSAQFNKKSSLLRDIGAAMDEAMDQQATVLLPEPAAADAAGAGLATHAARRLAERHGARALCVLPLADAGHIVGALSLERDAERPFTAAEQALAEHTATLLGPVLEAKRRDDRWIGAKNLDAFIGLLGRLFGRGHLVLKTSALGLLAVAVFLATATGAYRISAPATLEGRVQRALTAPLDGFIAGTAVRPGDLVRAGDLLAQLEDKDLKLEQAKWEAERAKLAREYSQAIAERDRAQMRILGARIDQAEARAALLAEQLARTRLTAPFDGVVVSGDLSQSIGAPVSRGDLLFELAPLDDYRVVLEVDERDIARVHPRQPGRVALAGLPEEPLPIEVVKLTPVAEAQAGDNRFRVEARLQLTAPGDAGVGADAAVLDAATLTLLRPGMRGIGKLDAGERKLFWIWTHRLAHWLRMQWWSWAG
ncbi:HlyD family efflux transporter periplasmic adaptor subunit [uncultured Thiohalocapsa sp.]|mgnify:CR=1 FL=1|uniref:HlyD family efflux transporter periplasmic adaptor subunit n=1 Tax=uncultured Thiohalocapsa sp. TaxID=768990 RepID=UPI0025F82A78|nr:HlyD family efflux transporter periplasmic adaptor subunit [uncultured Thiohalocapsa sp.]